MEAAVLGSGLDDPVDDARHLGGYGDVGHSLAIRAEGIFPDKSFERTPPSKYILFDSFA